LGSGKGGGIKAPSLVGGVIVDDGVVEVRGVVDADEEIDGAGATH